jgi:hypothetical protein
MIVVWGNSCKENIRIVERCLRSSARILMSKRKHDCILKDIYENLSWLMPSVSHKYFSLCLIYKILKLECIPNFRCILSPNLGLASHDTRGYNNLYIPNSRRNKFGMRSFFYSATLLWNNLSDEVRNASSYSLFENKLKCSILESAKLLC